MGKRTSERAAAAAAASSEEPKAASAEPEQVPKPRKGGTAKFKKGSKVLVPHTDQYYAAVVMQGQKRPEGQFYLLHYEGWSHKYDEWVEESGVVRYDRALLEQSAAAAGNEPGDLTGRRRRADIAPAEPQLAVEIPQQLRLHIPPLLKKVVLDDSTQVNLNGRLLPLPRSGHGRPSVADILKEYEEQVCKELAQAEAPDPQVQEAALEMVRGVRQYFDQGLRHFLLYAHELHQAEELLGASGPPTPAAPRDGGGSGASAASSTANAQPTLFPSECYGAEHLVRLFVKLPELVPVAYMTPPDVVRLEQQLHDLMARMTRVRLQARYFSLPEEYQPNPHFNPLQALTLQALLGTPVAGGGVDDSPAPGTGGPRAAGTPVAGSAGAHPPPVPPGMGPNSEAVDMD